MPSTVPDKCQTCGRALSPGDVENLCELCLLESGLRGYPGEDVPWQPTERNHWRSIGDYELTGEIARGGMGVVYRARQASLDREVALKMILVGHWASEAQVERFRHEARACARLDHPHIVPILELGEHEGWHYFTMKLIDGDDLACQMSAGRWPAGSRADQKRIASLIRCVAEAVHFAHQRGIIHRDLKPTNVLIDRTGSPFVTDFGLAKLIEETGDVSRTSAVLGTPAYMSPEQAAGRAADITIASDVYSLGCVLYELLSGSPPHRADTPLETIRQVIEEEIVPLHRQHPSADPDLAIICGKCLRREPGDRYRSAEELADDLGRWLQREPIHARDVTPAERVGYWARRNPLVAGLGGGLLLLVLLAVVISSSLAVRMRAARDEARINADENHRRLVGLLVDTGLNAANSGDPVMSLPWLVAALRADAGDPARELPHRSRLASVFNELPQLRALWFHDRLIQHAAISRDGSKAATASYDGSVRVWDTATGAEIGPARHHTNEGFGITLLLHVAFSPDGTRIVSGGNRDARIWDVGSGQLIFPPLMHSNEVRYAAFSPDGTRVVSAGLDRTMRLWDAKTGEAIAEPMHHDQGILTAAWSDDGRHLASGGRDRLVKIWDAGTGKLVVTTPAHDGEITHVEFAPDGEHFVTASRSPTVGIRRLSDGMEVSVLHSVGEVRQAIFSPDGKRLLTSSTDHLARIWEWRSGALLRTLAHPLEPVVWVGWAADGRLALTAGPNRIRVWNPDSGEPLTLPLLQTHTLTHAEVSTDGTLVLGVSLDGTARLWKLRTIGEQTESPVPLLRAFGPDGRYAIVPLTAGETVLWDLRDRREVGALPSDVLNAHAHAFNREATRLALYRDGTVTIYDRKPDSDERKATAPFQPAATWKGPGRCTLSLSPDGRIVALFGPPEARLFDALTGTSIGGPLTHKALIRHVAFSPDTRRILTVSDDSTARVWDIASGQPISESMRHDDVLVFGAFSPDGTRVVTTGYDGTARIWDAASGKPILPPLRHAGLVHAAHFSPDQRRLVTVAAGGRVRVWNSVDGRPVTTPLEHNTGIHFACFLDDNGPLLTVTDQLRFQLWELPSGQPLMAVPGKMEPAAPTVVGGTESVRRENPNWWQHLPADDRPLEELERWSLLLTGQRVEGENGLTPVDAASIRRTWESTVSRR